MVRKFSIKNSLFNKMLFLFILIVVIPTLLIGMGASYLFLNILIDTTTENYSITMANLEKSLENELFETKMSAYYMYLDLDLKEAVMKYNESPGESLKTEKLVEEKFENYRISPNFSNVNAVKVYGFNGFMMSFGDKYQLANLNDEEIINSVWYREALIKPDEFIWTGVQDDFSKESSRPSISLFRVIKDRSYTQETGMLYVNLDSRIFASLADSINFTENSRVFILDNNNTTVSRDTAPDEILKLAERYSRKTEKNYSVTADGPNHEKVYINYLSDYGWKIVGVLPVNEIISSTVDIFTWLAGALLFFLFFASFIWFIVLSRIIAPVKKLTAATKDIRRGDFSIQVDHTSRDELGLLTNSFNFMVHKIRDLLKEVVEENNRKKDAEYRALQAQINPHFLYNTLNSIRWMAIIQKADNIKNVVDVLGRLLRNSTSKMDQIITVEEETENLKDYVTIQKIAYNNKFHVEYDIDEAALPCSCLKFILQPLVENAVFHGILPKETYGTIWVIIKKDHGRLLIIVKDDGIGMEEEELNSSMNKLNGIGIDSIRERLQMTYEGGATFSVESMKNSFTAITITLPLPGSEA